MPAETREKRRVAARTRYERYYSTDRRRQTLLSDYGLSEEEYQKMLNQQKGLCAICNEPEIRTRNGKTQTLHIDHNHITGEVRALLCSACNVAIGYFREDPQILLAAVEYLRRFTPSTHSQPFPATAH